MAELTGRFIDLLRKKGFTPFEIKVYKVVAGIPSGQTRSYKWVAGKINNPRSSRAVGNALNRNPFPEVIPCHRVIRSDGSIGGFTRGRSLKTELLKKERIVIIGSRIGRRQ